MVEIDKTFGNRESETKSAELSAYGRNSLLKLLKQRSQPLRLNSNPCVYIPCAVRDLFDFRVAGQRRSVSCKETQIELRLPLAKR